MAIYESEDAVHWTYNATLLDEPGTRPFDTSMGRHPSVLVTDGRALIFYHVEAMRDYSIPYAQNKPEQKKIFLQAAELTLENGTVVCDRSQPVTIDVR